MFLDTGSKHLGMSEIRPNFLVHICIKCCRVNINAISLVHICIKCCTEILLQFHIYPRCSEEIWLLLCLLWLCCCGCRLLVCASWDVMHFLMQDRPRVTPQYTECTTNIQITWYSHTNFFTPPQDTTGRLRHRTTPDNTGHRRQQGISRCVVCDPVFDVCTGPRPSIATWDRFCRIMAVLMRVGHPAFNVSSPNDLCIAIAHDRQCGIHSGRSGFLRCPLPPSKHADSELEADRRRICWSGFRKDGEN